MRNKQKKPPTFRLQLTASGAKELARSLGITEREARAAVRRRKNPLGRAKVERRGQRIVLILR